MFNIALFEPEIPQNTGNIARLCAATGCHLHLIGPLGFSLQNKHLKRAGLDYWDLVDIHIYDDFEDFTAKQPNARYYYITTKGKRNYNEFDFQPGDFFVFGSETQGLPEELLTANRDSCLCIPMVPSARCLNLSNSVAIVVYDALSKQLFIGLS
ncbi:MAG: tRNA (uridine(34)/cytosine(34)/5-carboxymethylaminomethyluridine(34)-2'-O)-methyltransferase TrmL [Syntrophaceticus sp.]|nr:tRNA (uridine(34)/cytosine(34)/5-carboxymethylaminomethyluridine(34)-2'-O)-methyltransferase TrmL [Syntrophaceticus sp.]MDD3314937.1 tRNA (uridine(34)/cytosine(34)/5-carboxymethylaminomethyluridine(34)-2'-O)-methyltransferase TrmL [Syntrophaceticus sp.]MDD4359175.1 tRNA (uridine(34)/cytosine(34)/5-carboxymethylaminomethyluridine(34)-2'-O)-methyltransferase TrmL [Syntrophaceticus sp.]MDD4782071.1 tRNA (uridine(34)/cytosine(34)/5-carboxymethylaminomethyluridine(34)-2'-O)-methyltransferase TrmL 